MYNNSLARYPPTCANHNHSKWDHPELTRIHSSRIRTACSLPDEGVSLTDTPQTETSPGQRPFPRQRPPIRTPLPRTEAPWTDPPKQRSPPVHRFSNRKWVSTMCTVGNLWISETSLSKLEKFQCSSDLPNIKYNCALLFWSQLYWVFIYDLKYIFS